MQMEKIFWLFCFLLLDLIYAFDFAENIQKTLSKFIDKKISWSCEF